MARPGSERHSSIESLKERIARDPLSRAFLQLAEEYRKEGRYQEAVRVCLEGLERHPTYHTARISLGRTLMEAGNLVDAKRAFSEVLDLQPENHLAGKLLADVQKKTSDRAGAAETYRTILRYYPGDREVQVLLAEMLGGPIADTAQPARVGPAAVPPAPPRAAPAPAAAVPAASGPSAPAVRAPAPPAPATPRPADPAVDFQAGDLDGAGLLAGGLTEGPSGPWGTPPAGRADAPDSPGDGDDALHTNTLAELYLRQGLVDKAVEVYRSMLRVDPDNLKAARRLADLESAGAAPAVSAGLRTAPAIERPEPVAASRTSPDPPATAPTGPVAKTKDHRIDRLERWLETMRSGTAREANSR
ncbi:MAG TPA: tetratricopeptide repeat protein [Candidatus Polarisedimenticolia bacterium]|jgi:pentatricopeptide repeat protein|nr:tetratricopeptide repeat protein [Candidatus Polarisedimenticolia bacterium]